MGTEIGVMWPQPGKAGATEAGGGKERILPEASGGAWPPDTFISVQQHWYRSFERINVCCFRPPRLW